MGSLSAPIYLEDGSYLERFTNLDYTLPRGSRFSPISWSFTVGDRQTPINLGQALHRSLDYLNHSEDQLFAGCGTKVTYRIMADGYREFAKQMNAQRRVRGQTVPIRRSKVAKQVAQVVEKFIEWASDMSVNPGLRFGPHNITINDIYLVELRQVSPASFQPILAVRRPPPPLEMLDLYPQASISPVDVVGDLTDFTDTWQSLGVFSDSDYYGAL
ncbi:hypothetical protein PsYK624_030520 [Phanerochaete sordida]|uniref:Uncharacterized protein n=1 Tax=Phanerochaete sordida TaxID=48140 RepID=A0A9P3G326_9APHY|nr:hypothetical protein PsYK624_030520 [Phanerochaete sordida]